MILLSFKKRQDIIIITQI